MEKKSRARIPCRAGALLLCACLAAPAGQASAGTLRILPVRIEVAQDKRFCALTIANDDARPTTIQVRGFAWRRDTAGNDLLDPAEGPSLNPSIVAIPAGETRLIRCSLPGPPGATEQSWRLIVDELPDANPPPGVIQARLRISIPVFRAPARAAPALDWATRAAQDGATHLVVGNHGDRHTQVIAIVVQPRTPGAAPRRIARAFYLLAKGSIDLALPDMPPDGIAAVELETTDGRLRASPPDPDGGG